MILGALASLLLFMAMVIFAIPLSAGLGCSGTSPSQDVLKGVQGWTGVATLPQKPLSLPFTFSPPLFFLPAHIIATPQQCPPRYILFFVHLLRTRRVLSLCPSLAAGKKVPFSSIPPTRRGSYHRSGLLHPKPICAEILAPEPEIYSSKAVHIFRDPPKPSFQLQFHHHVQHQRYNGRRCGASSIASL